jgi:hypothetical protein
MANLAIASVGALASSSIGLGPSLGWMGGSFISSSLGGSKTPLVEGPRLKDLTVQTSTYGHSIPLLWGSQKLAGNLIWTTGIRERIKIKKKKVQGVPVKVKTYHYFASFAVGLCEGPIDQVIRIWADDKLIYDASPNNSKSLGPLYSKIKIYKGTEDQKPDTLIEADQGLNQTPAFRGLAYIVFEDFPLNDYHGRIPTMVCEISTCSEENYLSQYIKTETCALDHCLFHEKSSYLYVIHDSVITKVLRSNGQVTQSKKFKKNLPCPSFLEAKNSMVQGHMVYDADKNWLYGMVQNGAWSVLTLLDGQTLDILKHNAEKAVKTSEEILGLYQGLVVTIDTYSGLLRFYHQHSLERQEVTIEASLYKGVGISYSNVVEDNDNTAWFITSKVNDNTKFCLTCFDAIGLYKHVEFKDYGEASQIVYDQLCDALIISTTKGLLKLNRKDLSVLGLLKNTSSLTYSWSTFQSQSRTKGELVCFREDEIYFIDIQEFKVKKTYNAKLWDKKLTALIWDQEHHCFWSSAQGLHKLMIGRYTPKAQLLSGVIKRLCEKTGLPSSFYDIENLDKPLYGFVLSGHEKVRATLETLMKAYQFYGVESEGKIYFKPLNNQSLLTLKDSELGILKENTIDTSFESLGARGRLKTLFLMYASLENAYETKACKASIGQMQMGQSKVLCLPLVLPNIYAQNLAETLLEHEEQARKTIAFHLPISYYFLNSGDIITLQLTHGIYQVRLEHTLLGTKGMIKISGSILQSFKAQTFKEKVIFSDISTFKNEGIQDIFFFDFENKLACSVVFPLGQQNQKGVMIYQKEEGLYNELGILENYLSLVKLKSFEENNQFTELKCKLLSTFSENPTHVKIGEDSYKIKSFKITSEDILIEIEAENLSTNFIDETLYLFNEEDLMILDEKIHPKKSTHTYAAVLVDHDFDSAIYKTHTL